MQNNSDGVMEKDRTMSDATMRFLLCELTPDLQEMYKQRIRQTESTRVYNYVVVFPKTCKMSWSLIEDGNIKGSGSRLSPVPLGYLNITPPNEEAGA